MSWIESHQSLMRHPKTTTAVGMLQCNRYQLIGHLHALWWWGLDVADYDGNLPSSCNNAAIADAAGWPIEDADRFVDALVKCGGKKAGFIERRRGSFVLHDWWYYAGKYNAKRASNADRMKAARAANVQRTSTARAGATDRPNLTDLTDLTIPTDRPTEAPAAKEAWEDRIGLLSQVDEAELVDLARQVPDAWFLDAIEETVAKSDSAPWPFCRAILKRCIETQQPPRKKRQPRGGEETARAQLLGRLGGVR